MKKPFRVQGSIESICIEWAYMVWVVARASCTSNISFRHLLCEQHILVPGPHKTWLSNICRKWVVLEQKQRKGKPAGHVVATLCKLNHAFVQCCQFWFSASLQTLLSSESYGCNLEVADNPGTVGWGSMVLSIQHESSVHIPNIQYSRISVAWGSDHEFA